MSPALPKKERRYRKKRSRENQEEVPPEIPVKGTAELLVSRSHQPFSIFWALISSLVSSHMLATTKHRSKLRVSLPLVLVVQGRLWNVSFSFFFPQTEKKHQLFLVQVLMLAVLRQPTNPCIYSATGAMLTLKWKLCFRFSLCSI